MQKKYLKPSDGKLHVIMFNSFSKLANQVFSCEDKYTTQIDTILSAMQEFQVQSACTGAFPKLPVPDVP